jgi:hypothetical protein
MVCSFSISSAAVTVTIPVEALVVLMLAMAAVLLCGAVWVLAHGATAWANAKDAEHRARAHGIEADMQRDTIEHARATADAMMAGGRPPPTPDDIRDALLRQRGAGNGQIEDYQEFTTSGDVTPDELNEHMQGGEFRRTTMEGPAI